MNKRIQLIRNSVVCILLLMFVLSCKNNPNHHFSLTDIPSTPIKGEFIAPELLAPNTMQSVCLQSHLCHFVPTENEVCLITDANNGAEIGYFGSIGQGPEDMNPLPYFAGKSLKGDTIYMFDRNTIKTYHLKINNKRIEYHLIQSQKILSRQDTSNIKSTLIYMKRLENGYYVGFNIISTKFLFSLYDSHLNFITDFGEFPLKGLPQTNLNFLSAFTGTLQSYKNSIYYAARKFGYIARYDISTDGTAMLWNHEYATISYKIENAQIKFRGTENRQGFSDLAIGEKYIFATYSGIPSGKIYEERNLYATEAETLVILKHTGEVVCKYQLQSKVNTLCLSEDEKYLYVEHIDPEVRIERFKISNLITKHSTH